MSRQSRGVYIKACQCHAISCGFDLLLLVGARRRFLQILQQSCVLTRASSNVHANAVRPPIAGVSDKSAVSSTHLLRHLKRTASTFIISQPRKCIARYIFSSRCSQFYSWLVSYL